jgi:hypothetical protein
MRPTTLPKLDNGVEFQVVSMVNRFRYFSSREEPYRVLLFSCFDIESAIVERAVYRIEE